MPLDAGIQFKDIPAPMFQRLNEKTHDVEGLIVELQNFKKRIADFEKSKKFEIFEYNRIVEMLCKRTDGFKEQKRRIKQILIESGFNIQPGSELSKLLRLDNVPEDFVADHKEGTYR